DVAERARRHPRIRRHGELDAIPAPAAELLALRDHHLEGRVRHRQLLELTPDRGRQPRSGLAPRLSEPRRQLALLGLGRGQLRPRPFEVDLDGLQQLPLAAAALRMSQDGLDRAAVLSLQALVVIEPRLDLLEAPRLSLQAVDVAAEVRAQVLGLE